MIRYKIQGTAWGQERLTYEEILKVMEILKGHFTGFMANEQALGLLIDRLVQEQALPRLMAVLIKPHTRTGPGAWLNNRRLQKKGLTVSNICNKMTVPEIAKVLLDFFVLNVSWIQSWMPSLNGSNGTERRMTADTLLSRLKKLSTTFQTGTSEQPNTSVAGTP